MARVTFTKNLYRFFPNLAPQECAGRSVKEVLDELELRFPGLKAYVVDDHNELRKHVNVFLDGEMIRDRKQLSDIVAPDSEVFLAQALSGG